METVSALEEGLGKAGILACPREWGGRSALALSHPSVLFCLRVHVAHQTLENTTGARLISVSQSPGLALSRSLGVEI